MSFFSPELSLQVSHVLVVAPTSKDLERAFEALGAHMGSQPQLENPMNMLALRLPEHGVLRSWLSFDVSPCSPNVRMRILMLGVVAQAQDGADASALVPQDLFLENMDSCLFYIPQLKDQKKDAFESFQQAPWLKSCRSLPSVLVYEEPNSFQKKVYASWAAKNFSQYYQIDGIERYFRDGLTWALSF